MLYYKSITAGYLALVSLVWTFDLPHARGQELEDRLLEISTITAFAWSPSGDRIAYVSNATGHNQLYVLDIDTGSSRQITYRPSAVAAPRWSPDGNNIVYLTDPMWQERYEVWRYDFGSGREDKLLSNTGALQRNVGFSPDGSRFVLETNAGGNFDLAIWDRTDPILRPLVAGSSGESDPAWSPVNTSIAYLSRGAIWIISAEGGEPVELVRPGLGAGIDTIAWSPDGKRLLFNTDLNGYWNVAVYSMDTGDWSFIAQQNREQSQGTWSPDGNRVAFITTDGFDKRVTVADLDSGETWFITDAGSVASSPAWDEAGERLAFLMSSPRRTQELWLHDGRRLRALTDSMAGWEPEQFPEPEYHSYRAREGFEIPGLLYKPVGFDPNGHYPAVIVIHGGFTGQWINSFELLGQYLLQRGMVLFYPNPRGGGGYGRMYERLNDGDWGGGDVDDLLRADDYLRSLPFVDDERVVVWGGSYGGYLVYSLVTRAPDRFQAAVVRAGINDLRWHMLERQYSPGRFNNTNSYARQIAGLPDENPDFYRDRSPLFLVDRVRTPMLIMHGLRDNRVAPSQSRNWVEAMRENDVPVTWVEFPDDDHSLMRFKHTMSGQLNSLSRLFERYLDLEPLDD